jgi:PAS domain-containing protein
VKNAKGVSTGPDEFTLTRKDGKRVMVGISTHPVKIKDQTLVLGIARDITERKHAEKALKESEEKFRMLAEKSANMIFINRKGPHRVCQSERRRGYGIPKGGILCP